MPRRLTPISTDGQAHVAKVLSGFDVLNAEPEPAFDAIARAAVRLLRCAHGSISLLDADRQWFKAVVGLDRATLPLRPTFARYAVMSDESLVVPDARRDPRFSASPAVTGAPHVRFAVCAPIWIGCDFAVGALFVSDPDPRPAVAQADVDALADLAVVAADLICGRGERRVLIRAGEMLASAAA